MKNSICYQVQLCDWCYDRDESRLLREHQEGANCSDSRGPGGKVGGGKYGAGG